MLTLDFNPTVIVTTPRFTGSGTGVIFYVPVSMGARARFTHKYDADVHIGVSSMLAALRFYPFAESVNKGDVDTVVNAFVVGHRSVFQTSQGGRWMAGIDIVLAPASSRDPHRINGALFFNRRSSAMKHQLLIGSTIIATLLVVRTANAQCTQKYDQTAMHDADTDKPERSGFALDLGVGFDMEKSPQVMTLVSLEGFSGRSQQVLAAS